MCVLLHFCLSNVWLVCQIVSQVEKFNFWLFKSSCGRCFFHVSAVREKKGFVEGQVEGTLWILYFCGRHRQRRKLNDVFLGLASVCTGLFTEASCSSAPETRFVEAQSNSLIMWERFSAGTASKCENSTLQLGGWTTKLHSRATSAWIMSFGFWVSTEAKGMA